MKAISLFAGVGGLDIGFDRAGVDIAAQVEWDAACQKVLAHHWPGVPRRSDVRDVDADELRRAVGRPDILTFGFPCQDVSVAGRRAGLAGGRSGLYAEGIRLADALDPDWVVVENVAGLLSSNDGADFALVLGDLCGWEPAVPADGWRNSGVCVGPRRSCAWRVLDSQHFGVPQRRRRVFVVAHSRDRAAPAAVLLEPEGSTGNPPPGGPSWTRTAGRVAAGVGDGGGTISTLQAGGGDRGYRVDAESAAGGQLVPLAKCLTASERWDGETETFVPVLSPTLTAGMGSNVGTDPGDAGKDEIVLAVTSAQIAATLTAGVSSAGVSAPGRRQEDEVNLVPFTFHENQRGELTTSPTAGSLKTGGGKPGQGYPAVVTADVEVRRLTPKECERCQGWPDDHTLVPGTSDSQRYKQAGNGITANVAEWIGWRLKAYAEGWRP